MEHIPSSKYNKINDDYIDLSKLDEVINSVTHETKIDFLSNIPLNSIQNLCRVNRKFSEFCKDDRIKQYIVKRYANERNACLANTIKASLFGVGMSCSGVIRALDTKKEIVIEYQLHNPGNLEESYDEEEDEEEEEENDDEPYTRFSGDKIDKLRVAKIVNSFNPEQGILEQETMKITKAVDEIMNIMKLKHDDKTPYDAYGDHIFMGGALKGKPRYILSLPSLYTIQNYNHADPKKFKKLIYARVKGVIISQFASFSAVIADNSIKSLYPSLYFTDLKRWNKYYTPGLCVTQEILSYALVETTEPEEHDILTASRDGNYELYTRL
jgi:hypothetical protein